MLFCLNSTSLCTLSLHANASRHCKRISRAKCRYQASVGFFLSPRRSLFVNDLIIVFVGRNLFRVDWLTEINFDFDQMKSRQLVGTDAMCSIQSDRDDRQL